MGDIGTKDDLRFRDYLLKQGILTEAEIEEILRNKSKESSLGEALLEKGVLTPDQLKETVRITRGSTVRKTKPIELPPEVVPYAENKDQHLGKYILTTLLGSGGIGEVFRAWDTELRRWVAVKLLKDIGDNMAREWLAREAQLAAGLDHPNIVRIYDVGEGVGAPFIAMQLVEGQSLELAQKEMSLPAKVQATKKIAEALHYAHGKNVIHRDLKPANVVVDGEGEVFVLDFGLAKETRVSGHSHSISGMIVGTASYMSPEQARGKSDKQSDVYGIGATLYELVTGRPPFTGTSITDVLTQVLFKEPVWPRVLSPGVPRDLEAILLKALEKEKLRRYATVSDLLEDLTSYLDGEPLKYARRPTVGYVVAKKIRKQPLLWGLGAALLLSIFIGGGFGTYTLIERNREAARAADALHRSKALLDARMAVQLGEGKEKVLSILQSCAEEKNPDAVWLTEAGRLLYETHDKEMEEEAKRFLEEATRLDTARAFEAFYYLHSIETYGKQTEWSQYLAEIVKRARVVGENDNVFVLIAQINEAFDIEDYDKALDLADRAVKKGGKIPKTWNLRSLVKMNIGDLDGAIEDCTKAIELHPKYIHAWNNRGNAKVDKGDHDKAIEDYNKAIELDPKYVNAWINRGVARYKKGNLTGAIEDLTRAIELGPELPKAWYSLGYVKKEKGDLAGASEDFTRAIELDPKFADAWSIRGTTRMDLGDHDGAIVDLTRAIKLNPEHILSWSIRGDAKMGKGDFDGAIEDYTKAIELDPKYVNAWNNRGIAKKKIGDLDGAIADYTRAIELDPKDVLFWHTRGVIKKKKGDLDGAIEDYTKAIELDPKYVNSWYNRGNTKKDMGDLTGAIEDLTRVIELDPKDLDAWNNRGLAKKEKGDLDGAIEDYNRVIKIDSENARAWLNRGIARQAKGNLSGAIADWERVLKLSPNHPQASVIRASIKKMGAQLDTQEKKK